MLPRHSVAAEGARAAQRRACRYYARRGSARTCFFSVMRDSAQHMLRSAAAQEAHMFAV